MFKVFRWVGQLALRWLLSHPAENLEHANDPGPGLSVSNIRGVCGFVKSAKWGAICVFRQHFLQKSWPKREIGAVSPFRTYGRQIENICKQKRF